MSDLFNKGVNSNDIYKAVYKLKSPTKRNNGQGKKVVEKVIHMDINEDDSYLVKVLKDIVNNANITNVELYDKVGQHRGYNMLYGLSKRSNGITWESLEQWLNVLDLSIEITVKPRED